MTQHDHEHHDHASHRHPPAQPEDTSPPGHYEVTILAIRDLLIKNCILTADQIRRGLETLELMATFTRCPDRSARLD